MKITFIAYGTRGDVQPALVATRSGAATLNAPLPGRASLVNSLFGKWLIEPGPGAGDYFATLRLMARMSSIGKSGSSVVV